MLPYHNSVESSGTLLHAAAAVAATDPLAVLRGVAVGQIPDAAALAAMTGLHAGALAGMPDLTKQESGRLDAVAAVAAAELQSSSSGSHAHEATTLDGAVAAATQLEAATARGSRPRSRCGAGRWAGGSWWLVVAGGAVWAWRAQAAPGCARCSAAARYSVGAALCCMC
jgi:hypothetical protein